MKKTFRLTDLDCANCAAKIENAIREIPGVIETSVSFMAQKLTLKRFWPKPAKSLPK